MNQMITMTATGRSPQGPLAEEDKSIFKRAMEIRDTIENYHARVSIDQFNIEQVLSVLFFEASVGPAIARKPLDDFSQAISRTIELTCNVSHNGKLTDAKAGSCPPVYLDFWKSLFRTFNELKAIPPILTFNYDLVMERSLLQSIVGPQHFDFWNDLSPSGFHFDFKNNDLGSSSYRLKQSQWNHGRDAQFGYSLSNYDRSKSPIDPSSIRVPILKLHGSLNFPKSAPPPDWNPITAVEDPKIIPPVFNKADSNFASPIWKTGLEALRECRHLIICGYSLPTSDTYMQYFLKAALGPNRHLNKIFVFDPALFDDSEAGVQLTKRYRECFSRSMQDRIIFRPAIHQVKLMTKGTFSHMTSTLNNRPSDLLFGL